jgi:hypothetical protein
LRAAGLHAVSFATKVGGEPHCTGIPAQAPSPSFPVLNRSPIMVALRFGMRPGPWCGNER